MWPLASWNLFERIGSQAWYFSSPKAVFPEERSECMEENLQIPRHQIQLKHLKWKHQQQKTILNVLSFRNILGNSLVFSSSWHVTYGKVKSVPQFPQVQALCNNSGRKWSKRFWAESKKRSQECWYLAQNSGQQIFEHVGVAFQVRIFWGNLDL